MKDGTSAQHYAARPAQVQDAAALAALCAQLGYPTSAEAMSSRLASLARSEEHAVLVVASANTILGWIHVATTRALEYEPCAEILGLVVDEAARGRGVGAALVTAAEAWARARSLPELRVRSRDSRPVAHALYRAAGFVDWKTQLVFRKPLER